MKNLFVGLVAAALIATAVVSPATAAKKMAKTMTCPACHMKMAMKKSAGAPVAIKTKTGTYYCCAACASGQAAMKGMKHKGGHMGGMKM